MMATLRKWLLTGLLVMVPIVLTYWVLQWVIVSLDKAFNVLPAAWQPEALFGVYIPGQGLLLALAVLLLVGAATSNFFGRKVVSWWDALLHRVPIVRGVYSGLKQISDTLFSDKGNAFRKALLVQWPRPGMWTVAFLTGAPAGDVAQQLAAQSGSNEEFLAIYVPTTPNPTGGYFVLVKKSDTVELKMSVDEALKYIISMGVVLPAEAAAALAANSNSNSN